MFEGKGRGLQRGGERVLRTGSTVGVVPCDKIELQHQLVLMLSGSTTKLFLCHPDLSCVCCHDFMFNSEPY